MQIAEKKASKDLIILLSALADAYLEKGLYADAVKRYNQLIEFKVANKHIYSGMSKALIGMGKFDNSALRIYQRAIHYDPDNAEVYSVLATSFMREGREDEGAIQIYEMALAHGGEGTDKLATFLSAVYFRRNELVKCRDLSGSILQKHGLQSEVLETFLSCAWQTKAFNQAVNILKSLLDRKQNDETLLRHLCRTYLEKRFQSADENQTSHYSFVDRQLVNDFLRMYASFEKLHELMFFLELKRFLADKNCWGALYLTPEIQAQESLAYATGDASWSRKQQTGETTSAADNAHAVFTRLSPFESLAGKSLPAKSALTFEDFQKRGITVIDTEEIETSGLDLPTKADILITLHATNFEEIQRSYGPEQAEQTRQKLLSMLVDFLQKYEIGHAWCATDGVLALSGDIIKSVSLAIDFLNKLNRYNFVNEPQEQIHLSIGIHHSRDGFAQTDAQTLRDLCTGLKLATAQPDDLTEDDRTTYGKAFQKTDKIFLSAKAYREAKSANLFKLSAIGQLNLRHVGEVLSLHEVAWRNPTDELKFGYIKKISRFELLAEVGGKGPIKVYKAKDTNLQRFVILKVIQADEFNSLPVSNPKKRAFFQFATALGQLNHPNIVTVYEVDEDQGLTYIAREYVEAIPITAIFSNGKSVDIDRFIKAIYQMFKGLQYSHRMGFLHLNLKPNNVMLRDTDEVKLADFLVPGSIINYPQSDSTSRSYTTPEQLAGEAGDARSDIFAAGVLMYEALTRRHPFVGPGFGSSTEAVIQKMPPPPSELNQRVPRFCDALVLKCMEKKPENRFQSVEHIVNLLKKNFQRTLFSNFNVQIAKSRDSYA